MFSRNSDALVTVKTLKHKYAWFNFTVSSEAESLMRSITVTCSLQNKELAVVCLAISFPKSYSEILKYI
jgi:hypothetical protein